MVNLQIYLGDAVYAQVEGTRIKLMTSSVTNPTNVIYLEEDVATALMQLILRREIFMSPAKEEPDGIHTES